MASGVRYMCAYRIARREGCGMMNIVFRGTISLIDG
jgi:hypothetical protein